MRHEELIIRVPAGDLAVCRWPGSGPSVIAVHGITANALSFAPLAQELAGRVDLIAPDLRGRAGSRDVRGPYGLAAHVDDLIAIMDHLGLQRTVLVGHSMGGFVSALAATRYPQRFAGVLLVDGGVTFGVPPQVDVDTVLEAVIGPAIRRLSMTFPTPESYVDFWRAHPALQEWSPAIEAYALRDLVGDRCSCVPEAIRADGRDTLTGQGWQELTCPVTMLWAERGMQDEPEGLYNESRIPAQLSALKVEGVNHYTIVLSPRGTAVVADQLIKLLG